MPDQKKCAAFVTAMFDDGTFAATTRAADRGEAGRIGLPGGKLDPGETPAEAALREAREEGWDFSDIDDVPFHEAEIQGYHCMWFLGVNPVMREEYLEKGRITPIHASFEQLATPELGNDIAMKKIMDVLTGASASFDFRE